MLLADKWKDYELLDTGNGEKLERWGKFILRRPDGQVIWPQSNPALWEKADAVYHKIAGGGKWEFKTKFPDRWEINYDGIKFLVEPTGFKHTGLFPEQAVNWEIMKSIIANYKLRDTNFRVLNLFAYTGAASVVCAAAGADVVHVDASKGMNTWAKENWELNSNLNSGGSIRFITDDVKKFVAREIRRGNKYDGIIMDPPVYGRGPNGELWELEKEIQNLISDCVQLLHSESKFFIINTYTASISPVSLQNLLSSLILPNYAGKIDCGEIGIPSSQKGIILSCGIYARWEKGS